MDYENIVFIHNGILCSHEEGKWIELENIILSEVNLAEKTKSGVFSLIRGR
jgi:hypothetical protein